MPRCRRSSACTVDIQFICFTVLESSPRGFGVSDGARRAGPYRIADLWQTLPYRNRTLRRRTNRADLSRSVTARCLLTALPSRIEADELAFAPADGPTFF
jgi:hypothetical protein